MLAGCLTSSKDLMDDDEDPFGDEDHQVYVDMAKNTEQLCDSNGEIYSEGLFFFKKPIDEQKYDVDVFFQVPIDDDGGYVTILPQILFMELIDGMAFRSPEKGVKKGKTIDFGKSKSRCTKSKREEEKDAADGTPSKCEKTDDRTTNNVSAGADLFG